VEPPPSSPRACPWSSSRPAIRRRSDRIRRIDIEFAVEPSTNTHFIYERVLGGQVTPSAPFGATIERTGRVRFTPEPASAGGGL